MQARGSVRFVASAAASWEALRLGLRDELLRLAGADARTVETTLLVCPHLADDFADFNDFLDVAEAEVQSLGLEGVVQIASFHPRYRFAGTAEDDIANATNRSPCPTLQLLREASVERAVAGLARPEAIYEANIRTLEALGEAGWAALQQRWLEARD